MILMEKESMSVTVFLWNMEREGERETPGAAYASHWRAALTPHCVTVFTGHVFYNNIFLVRKRENHPNHVPEVDCFTNLAPRGETTKTAIWKKCHLPFSKSVQQKIKRLPIQGQWPRVGEVNLTMWLDLKNMSKARESEICSNVYLTPKLLSPRVRLLLLWASTS